MVSVSVIVPCYNYGAFLPDAIHSLIGGRTCRWQVPPQTFTDFEAIIVDDTSTDNSAEIAADLCLEDERVEFLTIFRNSGTAAAINVGIRASGGEYIYILSADDLIEPWTLELMHQNAIANPGRVCYGDLKIITGGTVKKDWPLTNYTFEKVITKNPIPAAGIIYPRKCWEDVGGYPESMRLGREGWAFNIACGLKGWPGHHIGQYCGYLYRWDGQNRSGRTSGRTPQVHPPKCATWADFYKCQIAELYPEYQRSVKMPGCCGDPIKQSSRSANTAPVVKSIPNLPGKGGFSIVEYIGPSTLDQTYWVDHTAYSFGVKKVGYVAKDHLNGILAMRGKQKEQLFVEVVPPPKPAPAAPKAKQAASAPEPEPTSKEEQEPEEITHEPEAVAVEDLDTKESPDTGPNATGGAISLAEDHGIPIGAIAGSGSSGRVTKPDVRRYIEDMEKRGVAPWVEPEPSE